MQALTAGAVCAGHAAFLLYCLAATAVILYLIVRVAPAHGNSNIFVYLGICSLIGSLSVMSVKVREHAHRRIGSRMRGCALLPLVGFVGGRTPACGARGPRLPPRP